MTEQERLLVHAFIFSSRRIYAKRMGERVRSPEECGILFKEMSGEQKSILSGIAFGYMGKKKTFLNAVFTGRKHGLKLVEDELALISLCIAERVYEDIHE